MSAPLSGVRVVEVTSTILGPYAGRLLAELGANVIKVEPCAGDITRTRSFGRHPGMGALFLALNRGKRSVALDIGDPDGYEALCALTSDVDVFLHNMAPPSARRLGVDYDRFAATCPRLVHCAATGFGPGPFESRPAYDDIIQAMSGIAALQGCGEPRAAYVKTVLVDKIAAHTVVSAILAALLERASSGRGQGISVPMFESAVAFFFAEQLGGYTFEPPEGPPGHPPSVSPQRRPRATSDGELSVVLYTDKQWEAFCRAAGTPELLADARFKTWRSREEHQVAFDDALDALLSSRSTEHWLTALGSSGIAVGPVREPAAVFDDPHLAASGFFELFDHPSEGELRGTRSPMGFSRSEPVGLRPAPRLGEHSIDVLRSAGIAPAVIANMTDRGVLVQADLPDGEARADGPAQ